MGKKKLEKYYKRDGSTYFAMLGHSFLGEFLDCPDGDSERVSRVLSQRGVMTYACVDVSLDAVRKAQADNICRLGSPLFN